MSRLATDVRLSAAISGFVGANGHGKSFMVARDTMLDLLDGRPVLSTMRFLDWLNPRPCDDPACDCDKTDPARHGAAHPLYTPWTDWDQFMAWEFGTVVADEIMGVASSREVSDLPKRVVKKLNKLRHSDLVFRWTGPAWARADIVLREVTQQVTVCHGSMKVRSTDGRRRWRQSRLIKAVTYDTTEVVDFRVQSRDKLDRVAREFVWLPRDPARDAYDTFDAVFEVGSSDVGGRCDDCGKRVRTEYCKCVRSSSDAGAASPASATEADDDRATAVHRAGLGDERDPETQMADLGVMAALMVAGDPAWPAYMS